ncbi:MAG: nucleotidyltransferase domain-containing protein [Candidatus Aenigmarchaeota archaeon]|nr:nucleotidyltransferase domain-containing protein [Candidatus Aenigmarchaeota archaeon]
MANKNKISFKIPSTEEFEILSNFKYKPFYEFGISEIMMLSGKKSKPWVFNTLSKFENNGLLVKRSKGNMNLYKAAMKNPSLVNHFIFLESLKLQKMKKNEIMSNFIEKIPMKNYCLVVFGSYAEGKEKKDSDIDICVLVESINNSKKLKPYINDVKIKSRITIHDHIITFEEFVEMLLNDEENLGKQIYKNHILAFNGGIFYELVKEANKHGFDG